jgi:hypothetical protein
LSEASRFNEEKLTAIFGSSEPYRFDQLNLENLSERDCLLIGEFVRRHHTRLRLLEQMKLTDAQLQATAQLAAANH